MAVFSSFFELSKAFKSEMVEVKIKTWIAFKEEMNFPAGLTIFSVEKLCTKQDASILYLPQDLFLVLLNSKSILESGYPPTEKNNYKL